MIVVTGAAGFIGSCLVKKLNSEGNADLILTDDFSRADKNLNLEGKSFHSKIHRNEFLPWFEKHAGAVKFIFHLGARTDTAEQNPVIFNDLNLNYSKRIWEICARRDIPLVYASSAATYGMGEHGFDDRHTLVPLLKPLNPYGRSKNDFDLWVLRQTGELSDSQFPISNIQRPPFWAGLKFFNVYGPNEYHKGRMASVVFHTFRQIRETGSMKLFRSHRPGMADGEQQRDFIYVKDVVEVCWFFYKNQQYSGLFNVGTGVARTFLDLATATFRAMNLAPAISFIDTPADILATYQYFTQANVEKLRGVGFGGEFFTLEKGVGDYVENFLSGNRLW
jgi:ADP-L-glycero-D-manno-heptose 6-epimerase